MSDAREQMIEQQVRAWHVLDQSVLTMLRDVPREHFVPQTQRFRAYVDAEVPLPCSQNMLRPSVVGRLLQALAITPADRALEVGSGSGFVTACLATGCRRVRSLEIFPELADLARSNLRSLGIDNAEVVTADAEQIDPAERYEVIAITGSLPIYDVRFQQQLEIGGRLFVVVGEAPVMDARLVRRVASDQWTTESLFETVVDPLIHAQKRDEFVF